MSDISSILITTCREFRDKQTNYLNILKSNSSRLKPQIEALLKEPRRFTDTSYEQQVNTIEAIYRNINRVNELLSTIIEKSVQIMEVLDNDKELFDAYMPQLNNKQISTLAHLTRLAVNKFPKETLDALPPPVDTVFRGSYGGNKRKTMRRNRRPVRRAVTAAAVM
jgi:Ni,Fe-hydrogenase I large subunit